VAIALLASLSPAHADDAGLEARLDAALDARALRGARVAALVVAASDGRELYARSAGRALVPASNQKILTALAALSAFGPAYRFRTALLADRPLDASGTLGTLYVVGGGDPGLDDREWWRLAADLRSLGLRRVRDLVLDDGRFERARWHPSWGALSSRAYHAPVGALGANYGAFTAWVRAGARPGDPVSVRVDPPVPYLEVVNRARTGPRGARFRFQVERQEGGERERVVVTGSLPAGSPAQPVARSVADPTRYAGAVLRMQLEAVGIEVAGEVRVAPAPAGAAHVHDYYGRSLAELLVPFLKWSQNVVGETLCKALALERGAARGSWAEGAAALRGELAGLGLQDGSLVVVDGSGLSYQNRASPRALVDALLLARSRFGLAPELEAALPIAGVDGTLRRRAAGARGRVRAKTGLLTQVAGLSGYALAPGGEERVFSVLVNGFRGDARGAMRALDAFAEALAAP
jgi:D-alanyl-D-alanine carboxypeptidase/D-alanyl-D-alanine-endopeptidase (penicillin-binding protein 4)